eukprot:SAG31_NODE_32262_length_357_cov_43.910853_2_plen_56_part_01
MICEVRASGVFQRLRKGSFEWEPYMDLLIERNGSLKGMYPVVCAARYRLAKKYGQA